MPLFGGKKDKNSANKGGYPTQSPNCPNQAMYPPQGGPPLGGAPPPYNPGMPVAGSAGGPPPYGAPPPYTQYPQGAAQGNSGMYAPPPPQAHYISPQPATVIVQGGFDSGARFGGVATPNIPPPPPGVAPNAAQIAAQQGHNVVVTQQESNWVSGSGSGAGYTWW